MRWSKGGIVSVLFLLLSTIRAAPVPLDDEEDDPSRLPKSSKPIRYDITLSTNVQTGDRNFDGVVIIDIEITADTNTITLHNRGLTLTSSRLTDNSVDDIAHNVTSDTSRQFIFITSERVLQVGELYTIELAYFGELDQSMNGFYISEYRIGSETRYLASTQFENTGARQAFFSYDEPEFKAVFRLSIRHASNYGAISNALSTTINNGNGTSTTSFETTPIMSTYLLAFVVSDFSYSTNEAGLPSGETIQRVYSRPDEIARTEFALEQSVKFLKQLEFWAKYTYELPKMFSAAIPDFAAGAMENWGLITYKEQYLILEETAHHRERFDSMRVIAHEIGHNFFGNLVTHKWWNYIWLNEGFATITEHLLVELEYPELRMRDFFNVIKVQGAFRPDALESSHPMTYDGQTQSLIIYEKAGSVIRMFQYALGDEIFRDAMSFYLDSNNHQPVTSDDLYLAVETYLQQSSIITDFNFTDAFKTWENQKGYPVIYITADDSSSIFQVTQQRYLALTEKDNADDNSRWYIPINYATETIRNFEDITITNYLTNDQNETSISYPTSFTSAQWFVFNKQQIGYYRVNYNAQNWNALITVLNSDNFQDIHVLNRAQLVDDALTFAADEYLDYETAFGVLSYLERETDYIPWRASIYSLDRLDYLLTGNQSYGNFQRYVRKLTRLIYVTYGLEQREGDTMLDQFARELAIDWTCRMGDEGCLRETYSYLRRITHEGLQVPKPLEITYICNGLRGLNRQEEFRALWSRLLASNDQSERIRIIDGLLCSSDPATLRDLLNSTLVASEEYSYKLHEIQRIWSNVLTRSSVGIDMMIDFIDEFYDQIRALSGSQVASTIAAMSQRIVRDTDRQRLTDLLDRLVARPTDPLNVDTRTNALRNFEINNNWVASDKFSQATSFVNRIIQAIDDEENQLILPNTSEPRHYNIHINATNIPTGDRNFSGEIEIDAIVNVATDRIIIHSREQTILDVQVFYKATTTQIPVYNYNTFAAAHTLTIYFFDEIPATSEVLIRITYSAIMQTAQTNYGFHITSYVHEGETRYLGVTQFESSLGSRFAFPHYDEPRYKATFELTLTHSDRHNAISNTFGTAVNNGDGTITTTFEETPNMSSYLLAFVISDLVNITNELTKGENDTLQRVWVRPDSVSRAWFALQSAADALLALEEYLDFRFALPKLDSAGIPNKNGAMENWGLITYWESAIIYQEEYADITHALKLSGVDVIAHEEAHQFFGNAATFEWWDYLWLSEGFATLFEYQITGTLHPDWQTRNFFNIRELHNAFRYDSRDVTRSMTPTPSLVTPAEIRASFDTIAYDKSGSVIRMFQNAVGEDLFRAALNLYLTDNQYRAVTSQNLFDAFQTVLNNNSFTAFDFATAFRTWELQKGYPIVHVSYSAATREFQITQERYFTDRPQTANDTSNWYIPLNFATQSNPNFVDTTITNYFDNGQPSITVSVPTAFDANQWFIFNKQQLGYYRVNYDAENWNALILALNSAQFDQIHVLNRVQLIDDAVNFAADGYLSYDVLFRLLGYLSRETEYTPWFSADRFISLLYTAFGPFNTNLNLFVRHLSKRFYDNFKLGADGVIPLEEVYERYGREIATRLACNAGYEDCLVDTTNVLEQFVDANRTIPAGLESVIWCNSFKTSQPTQWVELYNRIQTTADATFRSQIISALGCSRNSTLLKDYLESTVGNVVYTQAERRNVLSSVLNSNVGLQAVIDFITNFESEILSSYGYTLEELVSVPAATVKTRSQQTLFNNYLRTLTDFAQQNATRVYLIIENNFLAQEQSFYPQLIALIDETSENQYRLPTTSEPRHYKLHLDARNIPSGNRTFTGEVEIQIVINEPTDRIILHSRTQVIDELKAFNGDAELEIIDYHLFPETDTLTIYFLNYLAPNDELTVHINYTTDLVLSATGFYQTSYVINGEQRFLGATQFESTGGRYAFPHYDEPGFKAVYDLSITHDVSHTAIANTFETRVENGDGTATTTFEPSPIMSSYLLAFIVSDLESVDNEATRAPGATLHRVWVRPDSLEKARYAVEVSDRVIQALEEYVGFDYELPKLDSAGVPGKTGAMENWGMVTYRENAMIYEEIYEDISHSQKLSGVDVISHELAHQFFGDTVTCEWWDVIWLNEGFATVFEYHLTGILYPEWRVRDLFNIRTLHGVLRSDAAVATRPMTRYLLTPAEISAAFNYVVYAKAGSVLRMFQYTVGEDIFRAALKLYLETNNHKPVNSQHLVDAFSTEMTNHGLNDFNFDVAFRTWERQAGFPFIHVSYLDTRQFRVTQQRFYTLRNQSSGIASNFYIPLNFATASNPDFGNTTITNYFVNGQAEYVFGAPTQFDASEWFVFNKQQLGYYRVNYDLQNWNALTSVLNSDSYTDIHVLNRAQLIDDSLGFAEGDYLGYDVLLNILPYLVREIDYTPWAAADRFITTLYTAFGPENDDLNEFINALSENFYDTFKVPDDGYIPFDELFERYSRELALKLACNAGNQRCLSDTFNVNKHFVDDNRPVPKGLEGVVLCSGFRGTGKQAEWRELWQIAQITTDATLKNQLISALGCSDDVLILDDYLVSTVEVGNSFNYTQTERRNVLSAVLNSHSGLLPVINFIRDFESDILRLFEYTLEDVLSVVARTIKARDQETVFVNFVLTLNNLQEINSTRIIDIVDNNFQAQQQYTVSMDFIRQYLSQQQSSTNEGTTDTSGTSQDATQETEAPSAASLISLQFTTILASLFIIFTIKF